jgi:alkanesulfonate monooxygenase SsuD/methylene tetrahydromethanopterin reductase-like flavin-dependent oxidoreductase (luciferase family)
MKVGVVLPSFARDPSHVVYTARRAEEAGLDGVFAFDHLWPLGGPGRPALACMPILAAAAAVTTTVVVAPLVARVGLVDAEQQLDAFMSLAAIAGSPERIIGAFGVSDHLSRPEYDAYGLPFPSVATRWQEVTEIVAALRDRGFVTWIGGRSARARRVANEHAHALNIWGATDEEWRSETTELAPPTEVTWAGQAIIAATAAEHEAKLDRYRDRPGLLHGTVDEVAAQLRRRAQSVESKRLTWAIAAPLDLSEDVDAALENLMRVRRVVALA